MGATYLPGQGIPPRFGQGGRGLVQEPSLIEVDLFDILTGMDQAFGTQAPQKVSAAGAATLSPANTQFLFIDLATANANVTLALPDGTFDGQQLQISNVSASATHTFVVTPAHMFGGAHVTLTAATDSVLLVWSVALGNKWVVAQLIGGAIS